MKLIYKLFHIDPNSRKGIIAATSGLGIAANILIALVKVIIGAIASSIAIVSEGVNNASDALTSLLTLVGSRLAGKHPDKKHPFGYGRIEYLTSLVIAILILVTGAEMLISAIKLIFAPEDIEISVISLVIVALSAVIKYFLGVYTIKMGKKADSGALVGVGLESRSDAFVSVITIVSAVLVLIFDAPVIDACAGVIMSLLILKAGLEVLKDTVSELIGRPGEEQLARELYRQIRETPGILNAADMMLHNYGPDEWSGSVNVEIDHEKTVGDVYSVLHELQLKIMHEKHVTMVFGIYAVDNDHEEVKKVRSTVAEFVRGYEHVTSYHAIYLEPGTNRLYCDLSVDYELKDWDKLRSDFTEHMKRLFPENELMLTIETEFV